MALPKGQKRGDKKSSPERGEGSGSQDSAPQTLNAMLSRAVQDFENVRAATKALQGTAKDCGFERYSTNTASLYTYFHRVINGKSPEPDKNERDWFAKTFDKNRWGDWWYNAPYTREADRSSITAQGFNFDEFICWCGKSPTITADYLTKPKALMRANDLAVVFALLVYQNATFTMYVSKNADTGIEPIVKQFQTLYLRLLLLGSDDYAVWLSQQDSATTDWETYWTSRQEAITGNIQKTNEIMANLKKMGQTAALEAPRSRYSSDGSYQYPVELANRLATNLIVRVWKLRSDKQSCLVWNYFLLNSGFVDSKFLNPPKLIMSHDDKYLDAPDHATRFQEHMAECEEEGGAESIPLVMDGDRGVTSLAKERRIDLIPIPHTKLNA